MNSSTHHQISDLFAQLGLPNSPTEITQFIVLRRPLPATVDLVEAPFWTRSQSAFLREEWHADNADWTMVIDQLNVALREHPKHEELCRQAR